MPIVNDDYTLMKVELSWRQTSVRGWSIETARDSKCCSTVNFSSSVCEVGIGSIFCLPLIEEILLMGGKWNLEKSWWVFDSDDKRGCKVFSTNRRSSYEDIIAMVYEDFGLDKKICQVKLSYKLGCIKFLRITAGISM